MKPQPWEPGYATERIRDIANRERMTLAYKQHARDQIIQRSIIQSDVLYILRNGFVYEAASNSTKSDWFKYKMVGKSLNPSGRDICIVLIPDDENSIIKIITVMWGDEAVNRGP